MKPRLLLEFGTVGLLAAALFIPAAALAQMSPPSEPMLRIRLVQASPEPGPTDSALTTLADLLRRNMTFRSFRLLDVKTLRLPADQTLPFSGRFRLSLKGTAASLTVTLSRGSQTILNTRTSLHGRTPLVIGGVPDGSGGTLLFVLDLPTESPP